MSTAGGLRRHHVPALDGVRGIAVSFVLIEHIHGDLFPSGFVGVDLFFVLSGFLITSILLEEHRRSGTIHLGRFYLRRFLRLYPALALVVLFTILYSCLVDPLDGIKNTLADSGRVMLYYFNWHLVWSIPNIPAPDRFLHLWSLSVEEQFYLVWPALLLLLLFGRISNRAMIGLFAVALILPALARIIVWHYYDPANWWAQFRQLWIYVRTDLRIDVLAWGAALAWLSHRGYAPEGRVRVAVSWGSLLSFVGLFSYALFHTISNGVFHRGGMSLAGFFSAMLIAGAIWHQPAPLRGFLNHSVLRWVGQISYGVYLWHIPVIIMVGDLALSGWPRSIIILTVTFGVASLSYYVMERPILRLKDRIGNASAPLLNFNLFGLEPRVFNPALIWAQEGGHSIALMRGVPDLKRMIR